MSYPRRRCGRKRPSPTRWWRSSAVRTKLRQQVIFGLRPCDARGFVQTDQVFGGYGGFYFDPLYNARREATTLLAVTCRRPAVDVLLHCHRAAARAGVEGVDALFTQVEGGFTAESSITEKGEAALSFTAVRRPAGRCAPPHRRPRPARSKKLAAAAKHRQAFRA